MPISAVVAVGAILAIGLLGVVARTMLSGGGSAPYTIQGAIAEPTRDNRLLPDRATCPTDGRVADGQTDGPLPKTTFAASTARPVEGLFAPGQIVAFEFLVEAQSDAAPDGSLDFEAAWPKAGQRSGGFEATADHQVLCAFVDPTDPSARESTGSKATARFTDLPQTQDQLRASFAVQGLKRGDQAVVEVWLVAARSVPESSSILQTQIVNGKADEGRSVDIDDRTINYRMSYFDRQEDPILTLDVNDDPNPAFKRSEQIDYTITITNTAQTAIAPAARLDAFLDQQTKLANVVVTDNEGSITTCAPVPDPYGFSCNLGFMNPSESVKLVASVAVQPGAETRWTKEDAGCSGDLVDVCGQFVLSWKQTATTDGEVRVEQPSDIPADQPLSIAKLVPKGPYAYIGQKLTFTYRVSNAAPATSFNQLRVTDTVCKEVAYASGDTNNNARLDPGESWDYTCTVEQMSAETTKGESRVEAFANDGRPTTQSVITEIKIIQPALNVSVTQQVDNPNNRSMTVTNSGDALLDDVALTVTACSQPTPVTNGDGDKKLSPGESWSYTCTADQKSQVNVRVYATDPLANSVTALGSS